MTTEDDFFYEQSKNEEYGLKFNESRKIIGLPPIEPNWFTRNTSVVKEGPSRSAGLVKSYWSQQLWKDWSKRENASGHYEKEVFAYEGRLNKEVDRYRHIQSDSMDYILEIGYSYRVDSGRWECSLLRIGDSNGEPIFEGREISRASADSVLKSWGISRF